MGSCRPYPKQNVKARTSSTQQFRGKLAMRLEKSSNREAFEIDEVLNYSKMEDSPYQLMQDFKKHQHCVSSPTSAIEDHLFSSLPLRDGFTGYG